MRVEDASGSGRTDGVRAATTSARAADRTLDALVSLLDGMRVETGEQLPGNLARAGEALGVQMHLYLVDYDQRSLELVPFGGHAEAGGLRDSIRVDGTLAGRAFRLAEDVLASTDDRPHLWVPLADGAERIGVLRVDLEGHDPTDAVLVEQLHRIAGLVGHLVPIAGRRGDALDAVRRRRPRSAAAELIWQLLPPLTFATDEVLVTGLTEPCYDVGGDVFDYAVTGGVARLAIFDGTGHSLAAGTAAAVALAAYRSARRNGESLADTVRQVDVAVGEQFAGSLYVSAVLAELELATGRLRYVGAGHPYPLLVRRGKVVTVLDGGRRPLLGLVRDDLTVAEESLEPGDWIVMYTDGVTEARDTTGTFFGIPRLTDLVEREASAQRPTPETLRRLVQAVLSHQNDVLQDDATVMIAVWGQRPPHDDGP